MDRNRSDVKGWYVADWPPLAWIETALKAVALVIGILALIQALKGNAFMLPRGFRLGQLVVLGLLSLGLVAAIFDRWVEREVVAMIFVIVNNLGHWGMVVALAARPGPGVSLIAFAALMLLGDLVKLVFLKVHDFTVRDTPRGVLYGLTLFYVFGYAIILVFEALR